MTVQRNIDVVEQLILWLEDNVTTESTIHFDNEERVDSATALAALTRLLPQYYSNQPFTERYLTVVVSTTHLNRYDEMTFTEELNNTHSRIAKRGAGYFLKLWETLENAKESQDFYLRLSKAVKEVIAEAIKQGAQCIEFDGDAQDNFVYKPSRVQIQ
ncbi:Enterobacterial protein of unknown function (DUF957) [Shewanella psychrophila]|uniref:Uncharacterized protein n=1 Tax=Shewanella psychrophila TaxID=225848 RepID=A0A1S6HWD7_9GAMM|nr:DUF957 domain-containing protein [Shewanella psychrophila]AQS39792.1 Enterobacterial protein of unknown function (DUF957) [Shewanella psychrophila]